jgi:hypothetical protein
MSNVSGFVGEGAFVFVLCFVFLFLPFRSRRKNETITGHYLELIINVAAVDLF